MATCVVVGGGVCGITASILLKRYFDRVVLIEQSASVGGLLSSVCDENGHFYDQGTHIPSSTGVQEIDEILFDFSDTGSEWHHFNQLQTGNYFLGSWDLDTQTIDARKLEQDDYYRGIGEFLSLTSSSTANNIATALQENLGKTFYELLAKPVIQKLYGNQVDLHSLSAVTSINYFGANRIKAFDADLTRLLKQHPVIDKKLGYHMSSEYEATLLQNNHSPVSYYYPKQGGAQFWINELVKKAENSGVEFICSTQVNKINAENGKIVSVNLSNGNLIETELVFWSAPPVFALKAGSLPMPNYQPTFRTTYVAHLCFDKPVLNKQSHYLWNWDSSSEIFRITLYDNLRKTSTNTLSAEVLRYKEEDPYCISQCVEDLIEMNLIDSSSKVVSGFVQKIDNTFPVPTIEFHESTKQNYEVLKASYENILISGRFSGRCWLLNDVLKLAFEDIKSHVTR